MTVRDFIDAMRAAPVGAALAALGCKSAKRRGRMGPCPACGGADVLLGDFVWTCFRCSAKHDVVGTLRLLGGGTWDGALDVAERAGLWNYREPDRVPVVRVWRDPVAERRAADERWWWAVVMMEAEEAHALHWSWVDRALMEPAFQRQFELDLLVEV